MDVATQTRVNAVRLAQPCDGQGFPARSSWEQGAPLRFDADWQGKNGDPSRETEVRVLWTDKALFLRFRCRYRTITVFPHARPDGRHDQLWDRDVAEAFLQPDALDTPQYREFEISPNGQWIDLDIALGKKRDLGSGLRRRVVLDESAKTWIAELAIPMESLTKRFSATAIWKANFYRVEGALEPRFYSAWRPTGTPVPNFHVPEAFGELAFVETNAPRK